VNVSSVWETKLAAIRCHATQLSSSPMMSVPEERQRLFFGREYFVRAVSRASGMDFLADALKDKLV
jgi:LmbE family N-acetylglucosaminyl deacetylase